MKLVFENDKGYKLTSDNEFIRVSATIIGMGIIHGRFDEKNRKVMSMAVAEFLGEFSKSPVTLDITSYSYIEARAIANLISKGVDYPNMNVLEMFAMTLHYYMDMIEEED